MDKPETSTDEVRAKRWCVTPRTIRNWRGNRAPLEGGDAGMRRWFSGQRRLPRGLRQLLASEARKLGGRDPRAVIKPPAPAVAGAVGSLGRLEAAELKEYQAWLRAEESGDALEAEGRCKRWLSVAARLQAATIAFDHARKSSGELVERAAVERGLLAVAMSLRFAVKSSAASAAPLMVGLDTVSMRTAIADTLARQVVNCCAAYRMTFLAGVPDWLCDPILSAMDHEYRTGEMMARLLLVLGEFFGETARQAVAQVVAEEEAYQQRMLAASQPPTPVRQPAVAV